ncbi:hypothetical protein ABDB91_18345 [Desulfoscipio sp. XC116]|uniref:hypothetical protein n=1 Tax=Desulfoscipio sp. XC116 TaxID=3144975 RepID=UPI00325B46A4
MRIIDLKDRFTRILLAGALASLILLGLNLFSYYALNFSERRFINYASLMILGRKESNLAETILSSVAQIGFATGIFLIFSYFLLKKNNKNYIIRGLFIGFGSWFAIMSLAYIIGLHKVLPMAFGSALSYMITSSIWGIAGASVLQTLDQRYGDKIKTQPEVKKLKISRRIKLFLSLGPSYKLIPKKPIRPKKIELKKT